jgi:NAD(P)-dependent dehydrogenase (short-subunit alcohol dehydrogenase family)
MSVPTSSSRVAVITGISKGLGFALAKELADNGWCIVGCARDAERLRWACLAIGKDVIGLAGDVADPAFRLQLVETAVRRWGRLDALVNNASTLGPHSLRPILDLEEADLEAILRINLLAPLTLMRLAHPHLRRAKGLVLNISSDAATVGYPAWGGYGSSKAALDLLSKTAADEWRDDGIRVFAVDPSDMHTDLHLEAVPEDTEGLADPADVARALVPLFDGSAAYVSGSRLRVRLPNLERS